MLNDFHKMTVLITGATHGIGLATGLAFGRLGARCILTHRWSSARETDLLAAFAQANAPPPRIIEADVSNADDTENLLAEIAQSVDHIDVFVSNAAFGPPVAKLSEYRKRDFVRAFDYSSWPLIAYTNAIYERFAHYPRYIIGISSAGHLRYIPQYDAIATAKTMLEVLGRYLAQHLSEHDCAVNIVRPGYVDTQSLEAIIGAPALAALREHNSRAIIPASAVADVVVALASGWMDGVHGQIIDVDRGTSFCMTGLTGPRDPVKTTDVFLSKGEQHGTS